MISKEELEKWAFQLNMDGDCDATGKDIQTLITQALETMEELETAKRCLPVDKEFEVRGSWIGSVQNYIAHLEESLEREVAIREQNLAIKLCMNARITELESFHTAYMEWSDKTAWVQTDKRFDVLKPWGRHRADVLKEYIEYLENRIATDSEPVAEITEDLGRLFVKIHYPTTLRAGDKLYPHAQPEQPVAATGNGLNVALSLTQMQIDWICNTCASIYNTRNDDVAQGYIDEIRATLERHTAMLNGGKL